MATYVNRTFFLITLSVLIGCSTTPELTTNPREEGTATEQNERHLQAGKSYLERSQYLQAWSEFHQIDHVNGMTRSILGALRNDVARKQLLEMINRTRSLPGNPRTSLKKQLNQFARNYLDQPDYRLAWSLFDLAGNENGKQAVRKQVKKNNYTDW